MGRDLDGWSQSRNAFGAIVYTAPLDGALFHLTQLFLTREIWGIDASAVNSDRCARNLLPGTGGFIPSAYVERLFTETLANYLPVARDSLNLPLPLRIEAGLTGVRGYPIATEYSKQGQILGESIVWRGTVDSYEQSPIDILYPFFHEIWTKAGVPRPDDFDQVVVKYFGQLVE